jgi:hypothetical protein
VARFDQFDSRFWLTLTDVLAGVPGEDLVHVANAATLERSVPEMAGNFN